jgi:hypothetical protein
MFGILPWFDVIVFLLPYAGIALLFLAVVILDHFDKGNLALLVSLVGVAIAVLTCAYDIRHGRAQSNGGGVGHVYTMWWLVLRAIFQGIQAGQYIAHG